MSLTCGSYCMKTILIITKNILTELAWVEDRSSRSEVFLGKGVLKIFSKFTREHPCRSTISIKLQSNFIEIALRHGCSPVNLLHIFRTPFQQNISEWLLLRVWMNDDNSNCSYLNFDTWNYCIMAEMITQNVYICAIN